jgi:DNA-binding transcriptional LysR family regulator
MWLAPLLPDFLSSYPALHVEVDYSERFIDLVGEGYDAALRVGILGDNRLVARKLGDHQRILCASPGYLKRHGAPGEPGELAVHNCLEFLGLTSFPDWRLSNGARKETVTSHGSLRSNDSQALLEAARAGIGILGAGEWLAACDLARGTLVRVLPGWSFDAAGGIYLVRPSAQFAPACTVAFVSWMTDQFRHSMPWSNRAQIDLNC